MSDKQIRFTDPHYNELFRIPDGGSVVLTRWDGEQFIFDCRYIDATHFEANGQCFHICQHAEIQARNGSTVAPEAEPEVVAGYRVRQRIPVGNKLFVLAHNPRAPEPWVTWQHMDGREGYDLCHYYIRRGDAETDLFRRADAERTGRSYEVHKPQKP